MKYFLYIDSLSRLVAARVTSCDLKFHTSSTGDGTKNLSTMKNFVHSNYYLLQNSFIQKY
jgi:hypothetical protein